MEPRPGTLTYASQPADLPSGTLVQLFFKAIDDVNSLDAMRHKVAGGWRSISHAEVLEQVKHIALALDSMGVQQGDRVAILSENRPEWAITDYAALCHGAYDVPLYPTLPANQIAYILKDSGARVIFVSTAQQLAKIQEIWDELPYLEQAIVFDDVPASPTDRFRTFEQALDLGRRQEEAGRGADFRERALAVTPGDIATVLYTSGTTGQPKGVMLTHNNIYTNTRAVENVLDVSPRDVALSFLPLSHIFQRMVDYFLFGKGVTIAYVANVDEVGQAMTEVKPTIVVSVPRVYEKIYAKVLSATGVKRKLVLWARAVGMRWAEEVLEGRTPDLGTRVQYALVDRLVFSKLRERTGGRIRFFVSGGAPLNPDIARFFYAAGLVILEGYGLTETSPVTNVNTPTALRLGTVGKPVAGTEIRIADDGEILVRGPQIMKGYYNNPAATAEVIDGEGWFHTGDIGEIDADGFLKITDRKKELIVTAGGKNIAPQPIENQVKTNQFVSEAVLIGDRRPYPVMLVVPNFDNLEAWAREQQIAFRTREELVQDERVRSKVEEEVLRKLEGFARYELPKKVAVLPEEFSLEGGELTPTLKVKRRVVEQRFGNLIESLYSESEAVPAA